MALTSLSFELPAWSTKFASGTTAPVLALLAKTRPYPSSKRTLPFWSRTGESLTPRIQPGPPHPHPRRILGMPTSQGFRVCGHFIPGSPILGLSFHDQSRCSEASRDRASLGSRSSLFCALSRTRRSMSSRLWRRIDRCSSCDSSSPCGVRVLDLPSDSFCLRLGRNISRPRVSPRTPLWYPHFLRLYFKQPGPR